MAASLGVELEIVEVPSLESIILPEVMEGGQVPLATVEALDDMFYLMQPAEGSAMLEMENYTEPPEEPEVFDDDIEYGDDE
mmetsp:Transcript_62339/g.197458  ORF Transcript_62339/g.197458 Transcript_62339/m.197458 type:complete len:81 (+) Transcript_62339:343-585(+)